MKPNTKRSSGWLGSGFLAATLVLSQAGQADAKPRHGHRRHQAPAAEQGDGSFSSWLKQARKDAAAKGISSTVINDALPLTLQPDPKVLELQGHQPHQTMTLQEYLAKHNTPEKAEQGVKALAANAAAMEKAGAAYGVEPKIIASLWGSESRYGAYTGGFNVVRSLATLAYGGIAGRRGYFKGEMFEALKILQNEKIHASDLKGSWAGAVGQCQFMPSNRKYMADGDGDKKSDISNTSADVFASTAKFLQHLGWKQGEPWGRPVQLPAGFERAMVGLDSGHAPRILNDLGVRLADGSPLPANDTRGLASVVQPDGEGTQAYVIYDNGKTLKKWNNALAFVVSVGMLADQIAAQAATSGLAQATVPAASSSAAGAARPTPAAAKGNIKTPDFTSIVPALRPN
jgi:membrane-bound lytic murein transglycosylase B